MVLGINSNVQTIRIPVGSDTSDAFDCSSTVAIAIEFPAAMDGTEVSFEGSSSALVQGQGPDADKYIENPALPFLVVLDEVGAQILVTVTVSSITSVGDFQADLAPIKWLRLVSDAVETAERIIRIHTKSP